MIQMIADVVNKKSIFVDALMKEPKNTTISINKTMLVIKEAIFSLKIDQTLIEDQVIKDLR